MKRIFSSVGVLALILASCVPSYRDTALFQRSGRQKAIVAVLPVINRVSSEAVSWDLSKEFTDEIRNRVYDSSKMYLLREHGSRELAQQLNTPNPSKISKVALDNLGAAEFAVVTELIDQTQTPYGMRPTSEKNPLQGAGAVLNLSFRVRIIDLRHDTPKVILQEVVDHEQIIPRAYMVADYVKTPWGTEAFQRTPLGMAHAKIVRELVSRVETYIEAAR